MSDPQEFKQVLEGFVDALRSNPEIGRAPKTATVRVTDGTACEIEVDGHKLVADIAAVLGGQNKGPAPGALLRAGLGSCLAITYVIWAAKLGVPLDHVEVAVEGDVDPRGALGASDTVPVGYTAFRYRTLIKSAAPSDRIQAVIETADRHSAVLNTISAAIPVKGEWQRA